MMNAASAVHTPEPIAASDATRPTVFNILAGEATAVHHSSTGTVGVLFSGQGIEAEWVSKQKEERDSEWFSQGSVDLILVLQGQLCVEFEDASLGDRVLKRGDLLVLPPMTRCRAYHWPEESDQETIFFATYPKAERDPGLFTLHRWCTTA